MKYNANRIFRLSYQINAAIPVGVAFYVLYLTPQSYNSTGLQLFFDIAISQIIPTILIAKYFETGQKSPRIITYLLGLTWILIRDITNIFLVYEFNKTINLSNDYSLPLNTIAVSSVISFFIIILFSYRKVTLRHGHA